MSALSRALAALTVVATLLVARDAAAQNAPTADDDAVARSLFDAGRHALDEGHADHALDAFESAFALSGRPEMLYNVGVAAQRARRRDRALGAFRAYLERVPDADNAAEVRSRIAELEELLAAGSVAAHGLGPPPSTLVPPRHARDTTAPWSLTVIGTVFAAAGAVLLAVALVDVGSVEGAADGAAWSSRSDAYGRAPVLSAIGIVTACVGLLAAITGATWLLWPSW